MNGSGVIKVEELQEVDDAGAKNSILCPAGMLSPSGSFLPMPMQLTNAQEPKTPNRFSDVTVVASGSFLPEPGIELEAPDVLNDLQEATSPKHHHYEATSPKHRDCFQNVAGGSSKCSIEELVALEFAKLERMITDGHRHVLNLIRNPGTSEIIRYSTGSDWSSPNSSPFGTPIRQVTQISKKKSGNGRAMRPGESHHDRPPSFPGQVQCDDQRQHDSHLMIPSAAGSAATSKSLGAISKSLGAGSCFGGITTEVIKFELLSCWSPKVQDEFTRAAMAGTKRSSQDFIETHSKQSSTAGRSSKNSTNGTIVDKRNSHSIVFGSDEPISGKCDLQRLVIHPCSLTRAVWDVASLMLVIYDIAVLPLQFFDPDDNIFTAFMSWVTRIFWTIDLPTSFFTGYLLSDGFIMMKLRTIAVHYVKSWFVLDVCLVTCDWAELVISKVAAEAENSAGDAAGLGRLGKAGRVVRILRMIRLLRMARMREIIRLFTFRMTSEKLTIIADIVKCLALIIAVAHLMACLWYGICNAEDSGPDSWIVLSGADKRSMSYKYVLSLHWSLSQFQGGMDEFRANSFAERAFNVVVFLFAFMMAAVCVSGLTSSMTRLHLLTSNQSRQISILRRYLIQTGISDKLAFRVQRNALHAISEQQRLMAESKVELLQAISEPLRVELHFEMYGPVLEVHPFFEAYMVACPHVMHHICHKAMSTLLASNGDIIFNIGEIPENPRMYIVCNGHFEYNSDGSPTNLLAKDFLAEAALWTHWMHRGVLTALMDGRLCVMNCRRFQEIVRQFDHPNFDPRNYAIEYVKSLNAKNEEGALISDLPLGSEALLKEIADPKKKKKKGELDKFLHRAKNHVDLLSTAILPAPRRMMDGKRQSVLFSTQGDKKPKAPKLLRFDHEAKMEAVAGPTSSVSDPKLMAK